MSDLRALLRQPAAPLPLPLLTPISLGGGGWLRPAVWSGGNSQRGWTRSSCKRLEPQSQSEAFSWPLHCTLAVLPKGFGCKL